MVWIEVGFSYMNNSYSCQWDGQNPTQCINPIKSISFNVLHIVFDLAEDFIPVTPEVVNLKWVNTILSKYLSISMKWDLNYT